MRGFLTLLAALALPGSASAVELAVSGECPGPVSLEVNDLSPGGEWAIMTGTGAGSDPVAAGPCAGVDSGLDGMSVRMPLRVDDGSGTAVLSPTLPSEACGRSLGIIDMSTCTVSSVQQIPANPCSISGPGVEVQSFADAGLSGGVRTLAWDGYGMFSSTDEPAGDDLARYDALGSFDLSYATGTSSTGIFTLGDGVPGLYARQSGSDDLYQIDETGLASGLFNLATLPLDPLANVVADAGRGELVSHNNGLINRWSAADGSPVGQLPLDGYGGMAGEGSPPASVRMAMAGGCYLTYANGSVSSWDSTGSRAGSSFLPGAGSTADSHNSFSYAKGLAWVRDAGGTWRGYDIGLEPAPPWSFGSPIDADLTDYPEESRFVSSSGTSTWVSWDATDLYVAVNHPDVQTGGDQHWVLIYLGNGDGSAPYGPVLNTQEPTLPFGASHVIRWKADDSYNSLMSWDGAGWVDLPSWLGTEGSEVAESNDFQNVEFRIPRAALGIEDQVELIVSMVYEGAGFESTYNAIPSGSLGGADGVYDPDHAEYYSFDLSHPNPPNATFPSLPEGVESCNGVDDDGDGLIDEEIACEYTFFSLDLVDPAIQTQPCSDDDVTLLIDGVIAWEDTNTFADCSGAPVSLSVTPGQVVRAESYDYGCCIHGAADIWVRREADGAELLLLPGIPFDSSDVFAPDAFYTVETPLPEAF